MDRLLLSLLALLLLLAACQKSQEKNDPQPTPSRPQAPAAPASDAENWLVQGDFRALEGSVRSAGGQKSPFSAGERLLVTLHVGSLEPGIPLEAEFEIANEKGSWTGKNRQTLPGNQVRGASGMLQAVLQTGAAWPEGAYTLYVRLSAGTRRGEWFIPITLTNDAAGALQKALRAHIPSGVRAGSTMTARFSGPPGLAFSARVDQAPPVSLCLPEETPRPAFAVLEHTFDIPKEPGSHALYVSHTGTDGKPASFGEPFTVLPDGDGLFALRFSPHDGGIRTTWRRAQEGFLWIEDPRWDAADPGVLDVVVQTPREEVLYLRRMDLPATPSGRLAVPFSIPEFAPAGRLMFLLRRVAKSGRQEARADLVLEGEMLAASGNFAISELEIGHHPALPRLSGPLDSGRDWHFDFVLSGFKTGQRAESMGNKSIPVPVLGFRCTARLADLQGRTAADNRTLVALDKPQLYVPPRHRIHAVWRVPRMAPGRYRLYLECDDVHSSGSAQLQRLVEIR